MSDQELIFISYCHTDGTELALRLRTDLAQFGFSPWLDQHRLRGGSSWSREIEHALDKSKVVLALLSEGSFASEVCRGEQLRSLRHGTCVIKILVQTKADRPVYLEEKQYLDFSQDSEYTKRLRELADTIAARSGAQLIPRNRETSYDTVPPLPANFMPRPNELDNLRQAIVSDRHNRHIALLALKGMGGVGKTVLAQAVCRDEAVHAAFPQGVIWLTIGEKPSDAYLVAQMVEVARVLGEYSDGFGTLEGSARLLRTMLANKAALLVLDDVWDARHVYYFQPNDDTALYRILLTTRNADIVSSVGAESVSIGEMSPAQSWQLLARYAALPTHSLPPSAQGIVRECKGLPLALAMIGAMLREQPEQQWSDILDSLHNADLEGIGIQFPQYPYPSLIAAIDVGVNALSPPIQNHYCDLAVFKEDAAIPEGALSTLWHLTGKATRQVVRHLVGRSLARRDDSGGIVLHDLQFDYVRGRCTDRSLLHKRLVDGYQRQCIGGWHTGPDDGYFFRNIFYHLKGAGEEEELYQLLLDLDWIRTKLEKADVAALLDDFNYALSIASTAGANVDAITIQRVKVRNYTAAVSRAAFNDLIEALRIVHSA